MEQSDCHRTTYTVRQLEQDVFLIIITVQFILHRKAWVDERSHHAPIYTYKFQMVANAINCVVKLIPMLTVAAVKSITKTVIQRHPRDSRISC